MSCVTIFAYELRNWTEEEINGHEILM